MLSIRFLLSNMDTIYLQVASERDLRQLKNIGPSAAGKIITLREKEPLSWASLAKSTSVSVSRWEAWHREGRVSLDKPPDKPPSEKNSQTRQGHSPDHTMDLSQNETRKEVEGATALSPTKTQAHDSAQEVEGRPQTKHKEDLEKEFSSQSPKAVVDDQDNGEMNTQLESHEEGDSQDWYSPDRKVSESVKGPFSDGPFSDGQSPDLSASEGTRCPSNDSNGLTAEEVGQRALQMSLKNEERLENLWKMGERQESQWRKSLEQEILYRQQGSEDIRRWVTGYVDTTTMEKLLRFQESWHSQEAPYAGVRETIQDATNEITSKFEKQIEEVTSSTKEIENRLHSEIQSAFNILRDTRDKQHRELEDVKQRLDCRLEKMEEAAGRRFAAMARSIDELMQSIGRPTSQEVNSSVTTSSMSAKETINKSYQNLGLSLITENPSDFQPLNQDSEETGQDSSDNESELKDIQESRGRAENDHPSVRSTPEDFQDITRHLPSDRIYRPYEGFTRISENVQEGEVPHFHRGEGGWESYQVGGQTELRGAAAVSFGNPQVTQTSQLPDRRHVTVPAKELVAPETPRKHESTRPKTTYLQVGYASSTKPTERSLEMEYRGSPKIDLQGTRGEIRSQEPVLAPKRRTSLATRSEPPEPPVQRAPLIKPLAQPYERPRSRPSDGQGSPMSSTPCQDATGANHQVRKTVGEQYMPPSQPPRHGAHQPQPVRRSMAPPPEGLHPHVIAPGGVDGYFAGNAQSYSPGCYQQPQQLWHPVERTGIPRTVGDPTHSVPYPVPYQGSYQPGSYQPGSYQPGSYQPGSYPDPYAGYEPPSYQNSLVRTPFHSGRKFVREPSAPIREYSAPVMREYQAPVRRNNTSSGKSAAREVSPGSNSSEDSSETTSAPASLRAHRSNPRSQEGSRNGSARGDRMKRPSPKMPQFNGTMGEWDNFMYQFESVCDYYQMDREEKLQQLKSCLSSRAISFVRTLSNRCTSSYRRLCARLRDRFAGTERPEVLRTSFNDLKQRVDESLDEFADRVQTQAYQAYPGQDQAFLDMMATNGFMRGVRDRFPVLEAAKTDPQTVRQALSAIKNHSALVKAILGKSSQSSSRQVSFAEDQQAVRQTLVYRQPPTPPRAQTDSKATQAGSTGINERYMFPSAPQSQPRSPPRSPNRKSRPMHDRCYNCDQTGHFRAECPHLKDSPKANGR